MNGSVVARQDTGFARLGLDAHARVLVVGLGKTGMSAVRFLHEQGFECAVVDTRMRPPALAELRELLPDVPTFLGGFNRDAFRAATHLVVSPGLPLDLPEVREAQARGVRVCGDLDLFACAARAPVAAITGSNGKSTVTTLVGMMARASGMRTAVGGNLGTPMLDLLDDRVELYVLELSSFQLERSGLFEASVATVLNLSADHMDRYPDLGVYAEAKRRIFRGHGVMVLNRDDPVVAGMYEANRDVLWFGLNGPENRDYTVATLEGREWIVVLGDPVMAVDEIRVKGRHNLANALAALAIADACAVAHDAMTDALRMFPGLDHRMQFIAEIDGVTYVNDSKATNVGACIAALSGLSGKVVWIAGGDGKGADFSPLVPVAIERVRSAILLGRDAPQLQEVLEGSVPVMRVGNMREAVAAARAAARPGDTVLLAPACASLDQYQDYQERGRDFSDWVRSLS
jgi:UDP-N-acetylmuramoylalanine--D-glutamate ligase